jgi:hypothetical protein
LIHAKHIDLIRSIGSSLIGFDYSLSNCTTIDHIVTDHTVTDHNFKHQHKGPSTNPNSHTANFLHYCNDIIVVNHYSSHRSCNLAVGMIEDLGNIKTKLDLILIFATVLKLIL